MKSSREQFEDWYVKSMIEHIKWYSEDNARNDLALNTDGSYMRTTVRHKWESWQASRAAIEVVLPDCDDYQSTWQYQDAAELKIKGLGLSVK